MAQQRKLTFQIMISIVVLLFGIAGTVALIKTRPKVKKRKAEALPPLVSVTRVSLEDNLRIMVRGEGTVRAIHEAEVSSQVSGRVVAVSPSFVVGGLVKEGEVLISVDSRDYEVAVSLAEASVKEAESRLEELVEESKVSLKEWRKYFASEATPSPLLVKEPQIQAAKAALDAARANLEKARLDLARAKITAPFDGVVTEKRAAMGDYLTPGKSVGKIYSREAVEVDVYLDEKEVSLISIPGFNSEGERGSPAEVIFDMGGRSHTWEGRVMRTSGEVEEKTRLIPVVVRVDRPFSKRPPLLPGAFVKVHIDGRKLENGVILPDYAVRWGEGGETYVWVVNEGELLEVRGVSVAYLDEGKAYIERGLRDGERVVTTLLKEAMDGMVVRVEEVDGR